MKLCLSWLHFVQSDYAAQLSAGSCSNSCGGYRCPSGAVIAMSRQPSSPSSAAFFRAAAAVSRRSVMLPQVSVPVIKNRMCDPTRRQFKPVTQTDDRRRARKHRLGKSDSDQARAKQDKTGNGHGEETVRSEFFTHGTPPIAREMLVTVSTSARPCSNRTTVTLHSQKDFAPFRKSESDWCFRVTGTPGHPGR